MSGGEIAGIIAASAFLVIALAIAVPLVKLGKVMDEASAAVHDMTGEVVPLIAESRQTLKTGNEIAAEALRIVGAVGHAVDTMTAAADRVNHVVNAVKVSKAADMLPKLKVLFERFQPRG
jgi:uncharacterized protein YoxC